MNTVSIFLRPSVILLHPHEGRFLASDSDISANSQATFGHQVPPQRCRLATIVIDWHYMSVKQSDEHPQHISGAICHTFTATWGQISCLRF